MQHTFFTSHWSGHSQLWGRKPNNPTTKMEEWINPAIFIFEENKHNNNQICHLQKYFQDFDKRSTKRTSLRKYAQFFIKRTCFAWDWNSAASAFKYQLSGKLTVIVLRALNILFLLFEIFLVVLVFFLHFETFYAGSTFWKQNSEQCDEIRMKCVEWWMWFMLMWLLMVLSWSLTISVESSTDALNATIGSD